MKDESIDRQKTMAFVVIYKSLRTPRYKHASVPKPKRVVIIENLGQSKPPILKKHLAHQTRLHLEKTMVGSVASAASC